MMLGQLVVHFTPAGHACYVELQRQSYMQGKQPRVLGGCLREEAGRAVRNEAENAGFIINLLLAVLFKLHIGVILMRIEVIF